MCLAIPLKITEINGKDAIGEAMGMQRRIRIDLIDDIKIGEYVMVHAGFAIERLPLQEAMEELEAWSEVQDAIADL